MGFGEGFPLPTKNDGADRAAIRDIPPRGKRPALGTPGTFGGTFVEETVRDASPTGVAGPASGGRPFGWPAVEKACLRPSAARSAAGVGFGEGFPLPTKNDGADRAAIRDIPPRGKRPALGTPGTFGGTFVQETVRGASPTGVAGPANGGRPFGWPAVEKACLRPSAARSAAGVGFGEGFPLPTKNDGADRAAIRDIPPRGKRPALGTPGTFGGTFVEETVRDASPTGVAGPASGGRPFGWPAVEKACLRPSAARSAAGVGFGEGFPLPTKNDGADRAAIRDIPPRGKRPALGTPGTFGGTFVEETVRGASPSGD